MSIAKNMPWGTKVEMMPLIRKRFPNAKSYNGIFLGFNKYDKLAIYVIREGNRTIQRWHCSFWRVIA